MPLSHEFSWGVAVRDVRAYNKSEDVLPDRFESRSWGWGSCMAHAKTEKDLGKGTGKCVDRAYEFRQMFAAAGGARPVDRNVVSLQRWSRSSASVKPRILK
jgi:hypothetical protein